MNREIKNIIVSTHDTLYPLKGGGAIRTLKVAEEFKKRGHRVIIIAPTDHVGELSGIKVHWLHPPRKQRSQLLSSFKFNIRLLRKFLQFAKRTDIFFLHNTIAAATIPLLKVFFPFRFALDITDIHAEYLSVGKRNIIERILTPFLLKFEYAIIKSADCITVATEAMKDLLVRKNIPQEKIRVVYDGVEAADFSSRKEKEADLGIIHLGTIDRQHGSEVLLEAIPYVLRRIPEAKFIFVGGGRELPAAKRLAESLKVMKSCVFTDYLPCEKARLYLEKACIGVIPRKDNLPNRIITTLKLFEYWASATAVVASRMQGILEVAKENRDILFFEPADHIGLAEKIILLIENNKLRQDLVRNGLINSAKFNWERLIPDIVNHALGEEI